MLRRLSRSAVTIAYILGAAALVALFLNIPHDEVMQPLHAVKDPASTSLAMIGEISKLIMTLDAAMLAAAGTMLVKNTQLRRSSRIDALLLLVVFLAGAISYFGVYFGQTRLLTMVSAGYLDPLELGLMWAIRLQYGGIIGGVFLLGLVFARGLEKTAGSDGDPEKGEQP